ncbi:hypothetical protein BELL_0048g00050 [Botrytis elliptica]|uniref:Uncharacterized protein n=1 Tax=Botrytis elliptica TaxID=278938 RepID=A0A4Z1KCL8_9HELO|nr:hypothetical protein EAE99_001966 [Botrytis elliptica]TGO78953.1 hypothetical protein BELL_0048g00050 [Botrytis elliptica]
MAFYPIPFIRSASPYISPYSFIRSASPYISPYSSSSNSSSTSDSLSLLNGPERPVKHPNQFPTDEESAVVHQNHQDYSTLASHPRRFVVPDITLTTPYDFYYPAQPPTQPSEFLDPELFISPPAHTYSALILPQLRTLIRDIESTADTHLMQHLPHLHFLLGLLSPLPDFGLIDHNLPAFRAHVATHFSTARTQEEDHYHPLLAIQPEPELRMVFRIFDARYNYDFPRRAACLIYPGDCKHQPTEEMVSEGGVDGDSGDSALVYRQGWGMQPKYIVTASYAGDVGVQYPVYHF